MSFKPDPDQLIWFITETSPGFTYELVRILLERGDYVIATSLHSDQILEDFPNAGEQLYAITLDLTDSMHINQVVSEVLYRFRRIDILVNNAGYELIGAVEEASDEEIEAIFEANVLGTLRMIRTILPCFRAQLSGHIINMSSIGGLVGLPGWGIYNSTQFAIEGFSEALAQEVDPLGIHVTLVEPAPSRANFSSDSLVHCTKKIVDYEASGGYVHKPLLERQSIDPVQLAEAILNVVLSDKPPLHLLLGTTAYELASAKLYELRNEFNTWRDVTLSSDFKSN